MDRTTSSWTTWTRSSWSRSFDEGEGLSNQRATTLHQRTKAVSMACSTLRKAVATPQELGSETMEAR